MAAVDGLISGINTTEMIAQLMQLEAQPQTLLKNKVSAQNKAVTAYQSANTRFSSMLSAARTLASADTWGAMKATTSSDAVAVSAKPGTPASSLSFTVDRLAAAHTVTFSGTTVTSTTEGSVLSGSTLKILKADGGHATVTFGEDTSLQAVVKKINETEGAAYKAVAVQTAPGRYALQLTATATGGSNQFVAATAPVDPDGDGPLTAPATHSSYTLDGLSLGAGTVTTVGADAKLTVGGGDGATGFSVTSSTNTFADVLAGVTITAAKKTTDPVTVTLAPDSEGIAAKVEALVNNANTVLAEIASQTRTKSGDLAAGPLAGDATLRQLGQDVLSAVSTGAGGLGSLSVVGISVTRDGKVQFDKTKFLDALKADPAKARGYFDSYADRPDGTAAKFEAGWDSPVGLARKLENIGALASEGVTRPGETDKTKQGILTGVIQRRNDLIKDLNAQVESWDTRLELRRTSLERQWSSLEVALGKLQSQSSWLSGQLAGLPSYSR